MRHTSQCFGRFLRHKVCVFSVFVFCLVLFVFLCVSLFVFSCFCGEGWGTIFPQLYKSMEPRRWRYYCWIPRCGFPIPDSGFQGLKFRIPLAAFWIPKPKILDSTSENFSDPGTGFPYCRARFCSYHLQETRFSWSSPLSP